MARRERRLRPVPAGGRRRQRARREPGHLLRRTGLALVFLILRTVSQRGGSLGAGGMLTGPPMQTDVRAVAVTHRWTDWRPSARIRSVAPAVCVAAVAA